MSYKFLEKMEMIKKIDGSIADNYAKYLGGNPKIGFTKDFPEAGNIIDEIEIKDRCRGFKVEFKVRFCYVAFGENNEYTCRAIITDRIDISKHLPMSGFGSFCFYDELATLESAVITMDLKHDLMICSKICSWPFAKAIVQENLFIDSN